jgi:hypothetical protein
MMSGAWRLDFVPVMSLTGVILDALGGLYLAYDLLGGKRGPLRTLTKSVTYGAIFGAIYGLTLGVWFGLAGLLASGPALSMEIVRRQRRQTHRVFEATVFGLARAIGFGAAGCLSKDFRFGISFGILCGISFVAAYLVVGPPENIPSRRPQLDPAVLRRAVFRGVSIGLAAVLSGLILKESHAFSYGVEVGLVTGTSSGILVAVAPSIEEWVDNLPDRRLGGYGAFMVLIGSLFQAVQYLLPLFGL